MKAITLTAMLALMLASGVATAQTAPSKDSRAAPVPTTPPKDTKGIIMTEEVNPI